MCVGVSYIHERREFLSGGAGTPLSRHNCVILCSLSTSRSISFFAQLEHRLHKGVFQTIIRKKNLHCVNLLPLQILK